MASSSNITDDEFPAMLTSNVIDEELEHFKRKILRHPAIANLQNNADFQDYLDTQFKILMGRINCEIVMQTHSSKSNGTSESELLEKARCIMRLQNLSLKMHNHQCQYLQSDDDIV